MSDEEIHEPRIPWALTELLAEGQAPLSSRPHRGGDLDVVVVLPPGALSAADASLPDELLDALERAGAELTLLAWEDASDATDADVVLAGGWVAAPEVLRIEGARARGVLAGPDAPLLADQGWTEGVRVFAPRWMGGELAPAADERYRQLPTHRRGDLVHVHGDDPLAMLIAAELKERRPHVELVVTGVPFPISLPFEATAIAGGASQVAKAFSLATVGIAPVVRGWRPVATAMMACGLAVVTADTETARTALGDCAGFAATPAAGADAVEALLDSLELRAERSRNGVNAVQDWNAVARTIFEELLAL